MPEHEYTPSEDNMRACYRLYGGADTFPENDAEFDRFLARIKRDAAREALDGYADALNCNRSAAVWGWSDFVGDVREWASYNYPETEDQT